jgi:hypothetical protein
VKATCALATSGRGLNISQEPSSLCEIQHRARGVAAGQVGAARRRRRQQRWLKHSKMGNMLYLSCTISRDRESCPSTRHVDRDFFSPLSEVPMAECFGHGAAGCQHGRAAMARESSVPAAVALLLSVRLTHGVSICICMAPRWWLIGAEVGPCSMLGKHLTSIR